MFLRLLLVLLAMAGTILVSRLLGPEGRGVYYVPVAAAGVLVALSTLGLEQANVFLVGSRDHPTAHLASQNLVVATLVGSLGALLLLGAPAVLPDVFVDVPFVLLVIAGAGIPFALHAQLTAGLQNLTGNVTWQFRAAIISAVVQIVLLFGLALVSSVTVVSVLFVTFVGTLVGWSLIVLRSGSDYLRVRWDARLLRHTLSQSLALHAGVLLFFLHLRVDMFMVKGMIDAEALGVYSLAVVMAETVLLAPDSLSIALLPRQTGTSIQDAASVALRAVRLNGAMAGVIAVAWVFLGPPIIALLFGAEFSGALGPLIGLLPGMVFLAMQRACGAPILRVSTRRRIGLIYGFTLVLNVVLNLVWIPTLGVLGAALASSLSYGIGAMVFIAWTARLAHLRLINALRPSVADYEQLLRVASALGHALRRRRERRPGM